MTILRDDRELLEKFRRGDRRALELVYLHYVNVVDIVVRRGVVVASGARVFGPKEHEDRLDLIQETFVRAFSEKARLAYDGLREYRPYLLTICRNIVIDWARRQGREILLNLEREGIRESQEETEQLAYADSFTRSIVENYIATLPENLAAVHEQRYVLGVSQEEAARNLGLSRQRVRTLEAKLKKGLRRALTKRTDLLGRPQR